MEFRTILSFLLPSLALRASAFQALTHRSAPRAGGFSARRVAGPWSAPLFASGSLVDDEPAAAAAAAPARALGPDGLYAEDRHVSTLRFLVPKDAQVAFEHAWTERAERLSGTPGLAYFHVSKRGADFMGPPLPDDEFNYQAYAVWESEAAREAGWDAFVGGTGGDGGSAADYDGLFALSVPASVSGVEMGGGVAAAATTDKSRRVPREAFVASNRFGIKPGFEKDFEDMWAARDSSLADLPGFVNFQVLRRRGASDDDGNNYISYTTWDSQGAFNNWRESDNFKRSHSNTGGGAKESPYAKMPKVVTWKTFFVVGKESGM